ncbi:MAG: type III-B CRISPR-associated protein Cas10/Cmr2 [Deltaproteobacteria bacterium]|nr:type III-B CRISPR-associated protein Cas10/Cmr2 [Deltaproteobacteria bacterium]
MTTDWNSVLLAFLHDPPSKAVDIPGHESRARRILELFLGDEAQSVHATSHDADVIAARLERLPMPSAGAGAERVVGPEHGLVTIHPLSGRQQPLDLTGMDLDAEVTIAQRLRSALGSGASARATFLTVWRHLPGLLAAEDLRWRRMPADTRQPDHTLWHHADMAAAWQAAGMQPALLSLSLGPVQSFIEASRTLRDLWSGSLLLSTLLFESLVPVLEDVGPQALVYPSLRGVPVVDRWLHETGRVPKGLFSHDERSQERLRIPALPNRFLALVPDELATGLADRCKSALSNAWERIAGAVYDGLAERGGRWGTRHPGWDQRWDDQVRSFWEVKATVLHRKELQQDRGLYEALLGVGADADAARVWALVDAFPPAWRPSYYQAQGAGTWPMDLAVSARLHASAREVSPPRSEAPEGPVPPKCTLLGDLEQVGPAMLDHSRSFWESAVRDVSFGGFRLRPGERLSAVGLLRRFWIPLYLARKWGFSSEETRLADTATVAAVRWLEAAPALKPDQTRRNHGTWNGQWLLDDEELSAVDPEDPLDDDRCPEAIAAVLRRKREVQGPAPRYLAALLMDGDHLGRWLRGELGPYVREALHPRALSWLESLAPSDPRVGEALNARRPMSPSLHAALSDALLRFATEDVPAIVERHRGELVYAGGDDVLALLSLDDVLPCARALREAYRAEERMGSKATVSAGVAVFHARSSLRGALEAARRAERRAKDAGRNALALAVARRSGEHTTVVTAWGEESARCKLLEAVQTAFREGATDRWVYALRREVPSLGTLPREAFCAELRRHLGRAELSATLRERLTAPVLALWKSHPGSQEEFCVLLQSMSFLARGREV